VSAAAAPVLGVVGLGSMGYGAAVSAMKRGVATWGLDMNEAARMCGPPRFLFVSDVRFRLTWARQN